MDQDVPKMDNKVAFVGTDNKAAGKVAADWMIEQAKAGKLPVQRGRHPALAAGHHARPTTAPPASRPRSRAAT